MAWVKHGHDTSYIGCMLSIGYATSRSGALAFPQRSADIPLRFP
jgi:hypothetical protein